jgi:hypothetical protein
MSAYAYAYAYASLHRRIVASSRGLSAAAG